jgi:hypothetical protein
MSFACSLWRAHIAPGIAFTFSTLGRPPPLHARQPWQRYESSFDGNGCSASGRRVRVPRRSGPAHSPMLMVALLTPLQRVDKTLGGDRLRNTTSSVILDDSELGGRNFLSEVSGWRSSCGLNLGGYPSCRYDEKKMCGGRTTLGQSLN